MTHLNWQNALLQAIRRISLWPEACLNFSPNRAILNIAPSSARRTISVEG